MKAIVIENVTQKKKKNWPVTKKILALNEPIQKKNEIKNVSL